MKAYITALATNCPRSNRPTARRPWRRMPSTAHSHARWDLAFTWLGLPHLVSFRAIKDFSGHFAPEQLREVEIDRRVSSI